MRTILVTGATGFIGNYVIEELLKNNYPVVASSASGEKARSFPWYSRVQYIQFDLASFNDRTDYYALFNQPEVMIHLAWEGLPAYKEPFHYEVNLPRHFALLRNMILHGLKRLSVTGTCFEYGMQEGKLSEDMPSNPSNPYAIAKDALRKQLLELRQVIPIDLTWIRLFYLYGRGQNPNSLLSQLQKALDEKASVFNMSGGEQVRDYLPVEKAAEYIVKIALQQNLTGIINCCSGQPVTVKGLVMDYLKRQKTSVPLNLGFYPYADYEPMAFWGDTRRLDLVRYNAF